MARPKKEKTEVEKLANDAKIAAEITGLETALGAATAALQTAKLALEGVSGAASGITAAGTFLVDKLVQTFGDRWAPLDILRL